MTLRKFAVLDYFALFLKMSKQMPTWVVFPVPHFLGTTPGSFCSLNLLNHHFAVVTGYPNKNISSLLYVNERDQS